MAETYNEKITRATNWGGDSTTNGLPVSGQRVQEFIKDELNSKIGAFYKEPGGSMVYCFANEEDRTKYLASGDTTLIKDSFETISKYKVKINTSNLRTSYSVADGETGNSISFQFKIVDDSEMITDARATIELQFTCKGVTTGYTTEMDMKHDGWTTFESGNIDKYIKNGENKIMVSVTGLSTRASSQFGIDYNIFDLSFSTDVKYNNVVTGNSIDVPYSIKGSNIKYTEFFIDGYPVEAVNSDAMTIVEYSKDSTATLNIASLANGYHTLQVGAYTTTSDGTKFHANYHYYTFAKAGNSTPAFLMTIGLTNKEESLALSGNLLTLNVSQFEKISFDWALYDYEEKKRTVIFKYDDTVLPSVVYDNNGDINSFSFRPMNYGNNKELKIYAEGDGGVHVFDYKIILNVAETSSGIKETTDKLLLKLEANGRRNDEASNKRNVWEYTNYKGDKYSTTFNGITWNKQCGWDEETESLVLSSGASIEVNLQPMLNDWALIGGTFEIDFETFDIEDEDAVICECSDKIEGKKTSYFKITATKAEFSTADGVNISTRYKDNEKLKIAFIGNKIGTQEADSLIYIVVNGVLERAALITQNTDNMQSDATLKIGNPEGKCKIRLHSMRAYDKAISIDEAFNNYVVDSEDVQEIYEKNNILKNGEVDYDLIANKLPVMIFTGDMEEICRDGQTTKDEGKWYPFDVEFVDRQHPEMNFVSFNCGMKLQGTSSLGYPRKNFKLKTKDKNFNKDLYASLSYEIDPTSLVGNKMLRNKVTKERIDFGVIKGNTITLQASSGDTTEYLPNKKGKYAFKKGAHDANKWTLKADFMESSCSHNVGAGRSWNAIFEDTELKTPNAYSNNTYQKDAIIGGNSGGYKIYTRDDDVYCKINIKGGDITDQDKYVCRTEAQKICHVYDKDGSLGLDVRTAVDGFPMVCFYRTSHTNNDLVFMGQYNFINDKSSYEVFGFEDIEDPNDKETMIYDASKVECWEGTTNGNPIALFHRMDTWEDELGGRKSTYKARYPDPDDGLDDSSVGSPLYELSKWLVSTRHGKTSGGTEFIYDMSGNTVANGTGTLNIDSTFAERINSYQYGYSNDNESSYAYEKGNNLPDTAENRQKKFNTEKWEHFDVWKLAGYYVYLMRYGAVDQFVKNTMLFTDGNGKYDSREGKEFRKWFFINYDNDCLFGLRNNGQLAFGWDLDRQTKDGATDIIDDSEVEEETDNTYAMMGHESTLWNNLEADEEFMRMVMDLDNSMTQAGLNYNNMVKQFDTDQTEMWCERIYNANEKYKYIDTAKGIGDMEGNAKDNLWMLQGTRRSHRHWWIANHFDLLNAKWLSGDYKNTYMQLKMTTPEGGIEVPFTAIAAENYYFAWGKQKNIYESNIQKKAGETITFRAKNEFQGDPVHVYAVHKMSEINCSSLAPYIFEGSYEFEMDNTNIANKIKKLIIGNSGVTNTASIKTTTWSKLNNLTYLDITKFKGIIEIPLKDLPNLRTLKANGTSIASFAPSQGSRFDLVELPTTITALDIEDVSFSNIVTDFKYTPNRNLSNLVLSNNDGIDNIYFTKIIKPWIESIEASTQSAEIYKKAKINVSNINWEFSKLSDIKLFANFAKYAKSGNFNLRGKIDLSSCGNLSKANIDEIKAIFGENCFNEKESPLYIITPDSIFILSDKDEMVAGKTNIFSREIYPDEAAVKEKNPIIKYLIVSGTTQDKDTEHMDVIEDPITGRHFVPVDPSNYNLIRSGLTLTNIVSGTTELGVLNVNEYVCGCDTPITVLVKMVIVGSVFDKISFQDFLIKDPTYASTVTIGGESGLYKNKEYTFSVEDLTSDGKKPIGSHTLEWWLSSDDNAQMSEYITASAITSNNELKLTIGGEPEVSFAAYVNIRYKNFNSETPIVNSKKILILNEEVILTSELNPIPMARLKAANLCSNSDAMLKSEAIAVTNSQMANVFKNVSDKFTFNEFRYFEGLTELPSEAFANSGIKEITLPSTLVSLGNGCFNNCANLSSVSIADDSGVEIKYIKTLPNGVTAIPEKCFLHCKSLNNLTLHSGITSIAKFAFGDTGFKHLMLSTVSEGNGNLRISDNLTSIEGDAFETSTWKLDTTDNKLETFSFSKKMALEINTPLWGKYLRTIIVDNSNPSYYAENNILFDNTKRNIIRCAPIRETVEALSFENVQNVGAYAFMYCDGVKEITLPQTLNYAGLGNGVFAYSNVEKVDLSTCNGLGKIPQYAFYECSGLTEISYPVLQSIETIGTNAFVNCLVLDGVIIPNGVTTLEKASDNKYKTIVGCNKVKNIVLPDTLTVMGKNTIFGCASLESLTLPKYWAGMGNGSDSDYTVEGCPSLSAITLPVFSYHQTGEYLVYNSENALIGTYTTLEEAESNKPEGGNVVTITEDKEFNINDGMRRQIFRSCYKIANYYLPEEDDNLKVKIINGVLYNSDMTRLKKFPSARTKLSLPEGITAIEDGATFDCINLSEVSLPSTLLSFSDNAFEGAKFREIELPQSITNITNSCFRTNTSLESITMRGVTYITSFAFCDCSNLKEIKILTLNAPILDTGVGKIGEVYQYHPFGYRNNFVGTEVEGDKYLYLPYGYNSGSTENGYGYEKWIYPLLSENYCKFKIKYCPLKSSSIFVKAFNEGQLVTSSTIYAKSESGEYKYGSSVASSTYDVEKGGYTFIISNNLYVNEKLYLYSDIECQNLIGFTTLSYDEAEYTIGAPTFGSVIGNKKMFTSGVFGSQNEIKEEEMANITQSEYMAILSKLDQLSEIIKKI